MNATQNSIALVSPTGVQMSEGPEVNVSDILGILRRNWLLPVLGLLGGLTAALTYISFTPPMYVSTARILIDRSVNRYLLANKVIDEPTLDDSETGSQLHVLTSESIVIPVVRSLSLARDAEFVGKPVSNSAQGEWSIGKLVTSAMRVVGLSQETSAPTDAVLERVAVESFLKRMTVAREDVPSVISITFSSENAQKAADIANEVADTYLGASAVAKTKSSKMVSQVLQDRISELRQQATNADRVLRDFKTTNNLTTPGKTAATTEQISALNAQVTNARVAVVETKARLDLAQQRVAEGVLSNKVADNDVILKLRTSYLELSVRATEMESRVGPNHAAVGKLRTRLGDIQAAMQDEQRRITSTYVNEYQLAVARHDELSTTMAALTGGGINSQAQVTLRELENSAELLRNSYNNLLQRYNDGNKSDAQPVAGQDARIITRAAAPLRKTSRKSMLALGGGLGLGLLLGIGAALAREFAASVFRTPDQMRTVVDAYCAVLPAAKVSDIRSLVPRNQAGSGALTEYVLHAPYSRFTETLRNVKAMINVAPIHGRGSVVCVVSSVAEEGKTTVLTNLAALLASTSKNRVLVIDGDLHRRHLTKLLAPDAGGGLIAALSDPSQLAALVVKSEYPGFDLLPCGLTTRIPNAAELLGSQQMESLLESAREAYDFILIEAPPIMSVADTKMIERCIDQFILVVEWGRTRRRLVREALFEVEGLRSRLACVVLNKADPAALKSAEAYKGRKFRNYYEG